MKHALTLLTALVLFPTAVLLAADPQPRVFHAQGEIAGEVCQTTVILQSRLTATPGIVDGDVCGAAGWAKFEYAESADFARTCQTEWMEAKPENDYIVRKQLVGLKPGRSYFYRLAFGAGENLAGREQLRGNNGRVHLSAPHPLPLSQRERGAGGQVRPTAPHPGPLRAPTAGWSGEGDQTFRTPSHTETGPVRTFKTLPAVDQPVPVRFVVGNCMNYAFFFGGTSGDSRLARADATDRRLGYPAMESIRKLRPDFFVGAGDNVYYDLPASGVAKTLPAMRQKWHEQFVLPRVVDLVGQTSTFWMKDDHDYRYNDADGTGNKPPSHTLGVRTFREQLPVVSATDSAEVTYRTVRCGQLLQVWMVEGRDYRSPNNSPDGPEKTIWGGEQKAWLKRTILASDAPIKILVSPTPLVGPDDAYKTDNHAGGFRHEGEEFLAWLKAHHEQNLYIITGDRHWHYHSIHPTGCEEFACGALNKENARLGRAPGDPESTDPKARVRQLYTDAKPTGGYLLVEVTPGEHGELARLRLSMQDEWGKELYSDTKRARAAQPAGRRQDAPGT